jgi:hypothetical protein
MMLQILASLTDESRGIYDGKIFIIQATNVIALILTPGDKVVLHSPDFLKYPHTSEFLMYENMNFIRMFSLDFRRIIQHHFS